jgi:protein TonB
MSAHVAERRPLGALGRMSLVAGLHVGVLFVIARSLGIGAPTEVPPPMVTEIYKETPPPEERPRIPEPDIPVTRESFVIPDPDIARMEFETDTLTGPPPDAVFEEDPPPAIPQPQLVGVRPDPRHPLSKPEYSPRMIREGNQGTIEVEVYVMPNGRVADARVVKSTGFAELDLAAMAEAKRNWRLLPATRDGVPIAQWHRLRVTFKLNDR